MPRARRWVRSQLAALDGSAAADAELVVSELVTNALLHGEAPVIVRVRLDGGARIEVADAGRSAPIVLGPNAEAMTGRGLGMVDVLSAAWGVDAQPGGGKVVWAHIGPAQVVAGRPQVDIEELLAAWSDDEPDVPVYRVSLGPVSTELLTAAKEHMDNVVRELALIREGEASSGVPLPPEMAALIDTVSVEFADARAEIKRQAAAAAARGEPLTDLELHLPSTAAEAGERYLAALDEADRYARAAHLLTLAPPRAHRIFREWYVHSVAEQLRAQARGEPPPPARSFQLVLAAEVARVSEQADASDRLALLQSVTSRLADARAPVEMAEIVVDAAVQFLGVETARVRLVTEHGTLRSVARRGRSGEPSEPQPEIPLDSELPGAVAARTRRTVFMRSLAETFSEVPGLQSHYPVGRSGHAVPLVVGSQTMGLLSLTFIAGELSDQAEITFVESLADTLAQALKRAQLIASEAEKRETLSFLADATQIMISAREPFEVLEGLATHAVPRLGDWCTVYLAEGSVLRRVAMAIEGHPAEAEQMKVEPVGLDEDIPQVRAFRSGRVVPVLGGVGHLLEGLYRGLDFEAMGGDSDTASGLCVPIALRGERLGVIGLTFLGSGRRLTPSVQEALTGLADRAAIALDNARRWSAQREVVRALVGALLPAQPPTIPGVEFAARYLPAAGDVAGDWWEAEDMTDGTVLIGLGDAAGHGLEAVSQMSELRHGARALAAVESSPAALLADLNRRLAGADAGFATAVYGRLEPDTGHLRWASAGHVPPIHVTAAGRVHTLSAHANSPLGAPDKDPGWDRALSMGVGDTLVLYSDGVIERRDEGLEEGLARLVSTVETHAGAPLAALADRILIEHCREPIDDCCLLLIRRTAFPDR